MSSTRSLSTSLPFYGLQTASGIREGFAATARSQVSDPAAHESSGIHTSANPLRAHMSLSAVDRGGRGLHCASWTMHPAAERDESRPAPEASEKVLELADRIIELNMLEVSSLTEVLKDRLGVSGASGMMMMPGMMPGVGAPAAAEGAGGAPAAAAEEKKDDFAVKLTGYDAASKIKVIKEVRAVTDLGLKEAKEMVEKGEFVVKEGLGKEEAEALVKKLEEVGGQVKME